MNNTANSLFSEMQQHQRFQIRQEPMPTHMHEELLLQGMLVGARYGTGMMLQGPHDILYAETKIVTPAGTHKIVMMEEQKIALCGLRWFKLNVSKYQKRRQVVKKISSCQKDVKCQKMKHLDYGGGSQKN